MQRKFKFIVEVELLPDDIGGVHSKLAHNINEAINQYLEFKSVAITPVVERTVKVLRKLED